MVALNLAVEEMRALYASAESAVKLRMWLDGATAERDKLAIDIQRLQSDTEAEVAALRTTIANLERTLAATNEVYHDREQMVTYQRDRITELTSQADALRVSVAEQDTEIQSQRGEINRLTAHCQDLTAQLGAALDREAAGITVLQPTLPAHTASAVMLNPPFGDTGSAPAPAATVDWAGLPEEYRPLVDVLAIGKVKWAEITIPARRPIALCVISKMATDGALTMAEFDDSRPRYMPTASNMANLFMQRWSSIVKNAVTHATVEP